MTTEVKMYGNQVVARFNDETHIYTINGKRKTGTTTICGVVDKSHALIPWAVGLAIDFVKANRRLLDTAGAEDIYEEAEEASEKAKNTAADLGSQVHSWVEGDVKGQQPLMPADDRVVRGVVAWMDWRDQHQANIIHSERVVYSMVHDYIGTLDFVADIISCGLRCCGYLSKGMKLHVLGDIKTGNGIYPTMGMQTAAYAQAYTEETGIGFDGRVIVRLSKEDREQYIDRMTKKNERRIRKSKAPIILDFAPIEAVFLDMGSAYEADRDAFNHATELYEWQYRASVRLKKAQGR